MTIQIKRPEKKFQDVKVTEEDIVLFTLGIDKQDFLLPSERNSYLTDPRAVKLVEDIKAGKIVSNRDYRGINLKGADVSGADFTGCDFSKSCFYQTKASKCCFKGAKFNDAYIEECDFQEAIFEDVSLKRVFLRNNQVDETFFDEKAQKYFVDFDKFLSLVESGKIDIRSLTKHELLSVDIRKLDLTKVNLSGIDLSQFILDGVNLCGTYIDPKHLLSLAGLRKTYYDLKRTKDKKRKKMEQDLLKEMEEDLILFAKNQKKDLPFEKESFKRPEKKALSPSGYIAWPRGKEESFDEEKIDEETIVDSLQEPLSMKITNKEASVDLKKETDQKDSSIENGVRKITSKQRDVKKVNTKIKG